MPTKLSRTIQRRRAPSKKKRKRRVTDINRVDDMHFLRHPMMRLCCRRPSKKANAKKRRRGRAKSRTPPSFRRHCIYIDIACSKRPTNATRDPYSVLRRVPQPPKRKRTYPPSHPQYRNRKSIMSLPSSPSSKTTDAAAVVVVATAPAASTTAKSKKKHPMQHFLAGGCAGLVEASCCHPLDTIKTRYVNAYLLL